MSTTGHPSPTTTLTVEDPDQVIHAATRRVADIRGRYAAAVQAADGAEMWRCRQQAAEAVGQLDELVAPRPRSGDSKPWSRTWRPG